MSGLWHNTGWHGKAIALLLLLAFLAAPLVSDRYLLSVLILVFYFAYLGQAWNLLMGFAGQLSLGHALYSGSAPIPRPRSGRCSASGRG